jgi:hypothetical protein
MNDQIQELEATLQDLYQGRRVVVPHDIDHAHHMLMVAGAYIQHDKNRMWSTLREMKNEPTNSRTY